MKKVYSYCMAALLICLTSHQLKAATVVVEVEDFEFNPAIFTLSTGDTIMWMWDNSGGQHTTTSTVIPQGAASWDEVINNNSPMFIYVPTIAGSYDYICSYHSSMGMIGHFTVLPASPVIEISRSSEFSLSGMFGEDQSLTVHYNIPFSTSITLSLFDALGNVVKIINSGNTPAGYYRDKFYLSGIKKGIYVLSIQSAESKISTRIIF